MWVLGALQGGNTGRRGVGRLGLLETGSGDSKNTGGLGQKGMWVDWGHQLGILGALGVGTLGDWRHKGTWVYWEHWVNWEWQCEGILDALGWGGTGVGAVLGALVWDVLGELGAGPLRTLGGLRTWGSRDTNWVNWELWGRGILVTLGQGSTVVGVGRTGAGVYWEHWC